MSPLVPHIPKSQSVDGKPQEPLVVVSAVKYKEGRVPRLALADGNLVWSQNGTADPTVTLKPASPDSGSDTEPVFTISGKDLLTVEEFYEAVHIQLPQKTWYYIEFTEDAGAGDTATQDWWLEQISGQGVARTTAGNKKPILLGIGIGFAVIVVCFYLVVWIPLNRTV